MRGNAQGLSVLELLVSLAVMGVLVAAVPFMMNAATDSIQSTEQAQEQIQEWSFCLELFHRDVATATDARVISHNLILTVEGGEVRFRVDAGDLFREVRLTGGSWEMLPKRPVAVLRPDETVTFRVDGTLGLASMEVANGGDTWQTVFKRRSS
ncbi:MAG: hypothetical protein HKN21_01135 [Candidatus Eisenbacteria bacterium]|uniref:Prepilin-type N-terminal cleavage/methylation domain-containing protein n=1 Tax=Eiseniibacteriota bacterium TaxID=2212470 RepID=A0A7Y2E8I4_UNCEI|nr:hypothetical protein [Candidatus Eisenbacteria bacterium]